MPHAMVRIARSVGGDFSNTVKERASYILRWNASRRECIRKLWTVYRKAYIRSVTEVEKSSKLREKYVTMTKILNDEVPRSNHNDFYACVKALHNRISMDFTFLLLEASIEASTCEDFTGMYDFMQPSSKVKDLPKHLEFMGVVQKEDLIEILIFRMMLTKC